MLQSTVEEISPFHSPNTGIQVPNNFMQEQTTLIHTLKTQVQQLTQQVANLSYGQKQGAPQIVPISPGLPIDSGIVSEQLKTKLISTSHANLDFSRSNINNDKSRSFARSGISFDGSPGGLPADLFILQIETLAKSMKINHDTLLNEISFVLKGTALHWYWSFRRNNPYLKWQQLKSTFLEKFEDRRTDVEIRHMIESRRQYPRESFMQFYQHVWSLTLQCQTPYPEDRLIEVLRRNMYPQLQYHLTDRYFTNVNDLIKSCMAWENTWNRLKMGQQNYGYPKPSINELNSCDYSFDTEPTEHLLTVDEINRFPVQGTSTMNQQPSRQKLQRSPDKEPICFNCCDIGHTFRECKLPQGLFCHRCGYRNVTMYNCMRCSENFPKGQWRAGNPAPYTQNIPNQNQPMNPMNSRTFQNSPNPTTPPTLIQRNVSSSKTNP